MANFLDHEVILSKNRINRRCFPSKRTRNYIENVLESEKTLDLENLNLENLSKEQQVKLVELINKY